MHVDVPDVSEAAESKRDSAPGRQAVHRPQETPRQPSQDSCSIHQWNGNANAMDLAPTHVNTGSKEAMLRMELARTRVLSTRAHPYPSWVVSGL